jgi:hypothetical protein
VKFYNFWPKNDGENDVEKILLKFFHAKAIFKQFFLPHREEDFYTKLQIQQQKYTFLRMEGFQKKSLWCM